MPGELVADRVVVRTQREANRIHNKGFFGRPLSGGALELDLLESCYLAEGGRLMVERGGAPMAWAELLVEATRLQGGFEILYLCYRDLRERGYLVRAPTAPEAASGAHFRLWDRGTDRPRARATAWVRAESERSPFQWATLESFARAARHAAVAPRLCIVDEESDLTYYELSTQPPHGGRGEAEPGTPVRAFLLADRVLVADAADAQRLHAEGFLGKPVATGLQLSLVEALHLMGRGELHLVDGGTGRRLGVDAARRRGLRVEPHLEQRLAVYADLRRRGLTVKTGFKFGTHFRAYDGAPEEGHAPFLVQAIARDHVSPWEPVARAIRLSHSVRKRLYFAAASRADVSYLAFERHRP